MSIGDPLFPWLIVVLALWVTSSTVVMIRNWQKICKLEQHNKLLQVMTVEGIGRCLKPQTNTSVEPSPEENS